MRNLVLEDDELELLLELLDNEASELEGRSKDGDGDNAREDVVDRLRRKSLIIGGDGLHPSAIGGRR